MKKFVQLILIILCVTSVSAIDLLIEETPDVLVVINGEFAELSDPTIMSRYGVMLPIRSIAEKLRVPVIWNRESRGAQFGEEIMVIADRDTILCKTGELPLSTKPVIYRGKLYVPLDCLEKVFGVQVIWDSEIARVYIKPAEEYEETLNYLKNMWIMRSSESSYISYDYSNRYVETDKKTGADLIDEKQSGKTTYGLKSQECLDVGAATKRTEQRDYRYDYKNGVLHKINNNKLQIVHDPVEIKRFINSVQGNLNIGLNVTDPHNLQKLAAVFKLEKEGKYVILKGSVLTLTPQWASGKYTRNEVKYEINAQTMRILKIMYHQSWEKHIPRATIKCTSDSSLEYFDF